MIAAAIGRFILKKLKQFFASNLIGHQISKNLGPLLIGVLNEVEGRDRAGLAVVEIVHDPLKPDYVFGVLMLITQHLLLPLCRT